MKTNFLESFMKIRDQLASSISNQNDLLDFLTDLVNSGQNAQSDINEFFTTTPNVSISDTEGYFTSSFSKNSDGDIEITTAYDQTVFPNTAADIVNISAEDIENGVDLLSLSIIENDNVKSVLGNLSFQNLLQNINDATVLNTTIASVNDMLLNNGHASLDQVNTVVDGYFSQSGDYLSQFKALVANYGEEIDAYSWSNILEGIYSGGKEATTRDSLRMDESKNGILQGFIGSIALQAVAQIIEMASILLAAFTYGLTLILSFAVNIISGILNQQVDYTVNYKSTTNYLDYPMSASYYSDNLDDFAPSGYSFTNSDPAQNLSTPYASHFIWRRNNKWCVNSFVKYGLDITKVRNSCFALASAGSNYVGYNGYFTDNVMDDLYMDESTFYTGLNDINVINKSLTAALIMWFIDNFGYPNGYYPTNQYQIRFYDQWDSNHSWVNFDAFSNNAEDINHFFGQLFHNINAFAKYAAFANEGQVARMIDWIRGLTNLGSTAYYLVSSTSDALMVANGEVSQTRLNIGFCEQKAFRSWNDGVKYFSDGGEVIGEVSSIPSDRLLELPNVDRASLYMTMAIIAVSAVVIAYAGTKISKAIKKRKFFSKNKRTAKVKAAKKAYEDNPTKENALKFYKEQKSYNFKAKLFGWSTYDATNDWFDAPSSGVTSSASSLSKVVTDVGSDASNVDAIIKLIKT